MMLDIKNITKSYGNKSILENFSFSISANKIYGLIGKNGSGKTTLLKIISGLLMQDSGEISYSLKDLQVSYVDNNPRSFFMRISCWQNLYYYGSLNGLSKKEVLTFLDKNFGLAKIDFFDKDLNQLSRGQVQVVGVARALLSAPDIIILDEIFGTLDQANTKNISEIIKNYMSRNQNITTIICSHDHRFINDICDRGY